MSTLLKGLTAIFLAIVGGIVATMLWESSLFAAWHTNNQIDKLLNWLGFQTSVRRIWIVGLLLWSLASLFYILVDSRRIRIHSASYDTVNKRTDVTEFLRKKVEQEGLRRIPVTNIFFGDGDHNYDPDKGTGKILTVVYSIYGRKKPPKIELENKILTLP